jgi:hypothetical protein
LTQTEQTTEWQQYIDGQEYNTRVGLYENGNKNERFYAGDQWAGVQANGLPTPVFNIFKRIINYFIATIMSQNVSMQFVPENVGDNPETPEEMEISEASQTISEYSDTLFEKNKMLFKLRQWLLDAALSGDAACYNYWDATIQTLQAVLGDICIESIDSVNVMFGNPNDVRVQSQPYILIVFRQLVSDLKDEAELYKVAQTQIDMITTDVDTEYQSGDRAKIELNQNNSVAGKTTAILKLWKSNGKIMAKKTTRYTDIRPEWDTKLTRYPVAWMNWDPRKNSYHGQALGTGLVPNQIFINKAFAMAMMSMMHTAFPKLVYNKSVITAVNNQIGGAIGIDSADPLMNVNNAASYMQTGNMSEQVFKLIDLAIQYTKDMLGATDAALGDIKPDNTSAIIAVQQASGIPLETVKQNLYQFVEDIGYNMLDMMAANYGKRKIDVMVMGKRVIKEFDFSILKRMKFRIKIDVGPSSYWSQISAMQTLDALLTADRISFIQYLERVPMGMIPKSAELIEEVKMQDTKQQFIWEQMARFMESLDPQMQMELQSMKPEEMEAKLMEMMMQPPEVTQQQQAEQQAQQQQALMQEQQNQQTAQQQEQMKTQQQFEQTAQLKAMDIEGKLMLEDRKQAKVGAS